jgi:hypothetical protein
MEETNRGLDNLKPGPGPSRARKGKEGFLSPHLQKVIKKAAQIADLMTNEDVEADLKVLRDAKKATHHVYDTKKKKLVKVPDHKTRLAATTLSRAYHEGKPVERSISATGKFEDLLELQERVSQSQVFKQITSQKAVLGKEITPALQDFQGPDHSGSGNGPAL